MLVRRAPQSGLEALAWRLGKGGRPNWRAAAEFLATAHDPQLLEGPKPTKAGRPSEHNWPLLVRDVGLVRFLMRLEGRKCGVLQACRLLSNGQWPRHKTYRIPSGADVYIPPVSAQWMGQNPKSLEQRFHETTRPIRTPRQK